MVKLELINQEILAEEIKSLERGYVETAINLIKGPVFIESVSKDLVTAEGERKAALEKVLANHESNQKANEEAVEQLNRIIEAAKKLVTR